MNDDDLVQRLLFAEDHFLAALEGGTQMLASFNQVWSELPDILQRTLKTGSVGNETLGLTYSVSSRIAILASCFLDIRREVELSSASFKSDFDAILHQLATLDLNANPKSLDNKYDARSCSHSNTPIPSAKSSSPPFLASAYQWLMDNLHNPYPAAEVKAQIAAASSCKASSINSWFVNARRRIGWTTLCREHFSNRKADMFDAAYRALVEEDPQRPLSPGLMHSFQEMKVAAQDLYPTTFTGSAFARDLDSIANNITEKGRRSVEVGKGGEVGQVNVVKTVRDSYPSPDRSTTASPLPAFDVSQTDTSEEDDVAPPIIAGSKRRRSSIESSNQPSSTTTRPTKRLRASTISQTYPSPPSSINGIDELRDHSFPELSTAVHSTQPETNQVLPSGKRCVSGAATTGTPKPSHGSMATPHHVVSDPLPYSLMENDYSFDDWFNIDFNSLFAIPPPVDATAPDFSAPWEVEFFEDYRIPENPKHTLQGPSAPMVNTQVSAPADSCDFEGLLQSIGGDTYVALPEREPLSNMIGPTGTTSFIPDISQADIDWTSFLNTTEIYQPIIDSAFTQYPSDSPPLPEIDLSMLQLPHVIPIANPEPDVTSKQAKLQQLHAMQEAVRRMEQELQSEGLVL